MIAGILCIKNVFVYNKCSSSGFWSVSHPDLSDGAILAKYVIP